MGTCKKIEEWCVKNGKQKFEYILSDDGGGERGPHLRRPEPMEADAENNADEENGVDDLTCCRAGIVPKPSGSRCAAMCLEIPVADFMEEPDIP